MKSYSDDQKAIIEGFAMLDGVEQMIFLCGLNAVTRKRITVEQFDERVQAMFDLHRAGGRVTLRKLAKAGLHPAQDHAAAVA